MPSDTEQMALTVNGKKRNIKKKDFLSLAQNLGLEIKVATGLMRQLLKYKKEFIDIINSSFISEKMKEELENLMETRTADIV